MNPQTETNPNTMDPASAAPPGTTALPAGTATTSVAAHRDDPSHFEETKEKAQTKARELGNKTQRAVEERGNQYLETARTKVRNLERAAEDAANKLEQEQPDRVAQGVHELAGQIGALADYLESHDSRQVIADTRRVVRRHPAAVLGTLTAVGFVAGRFLKASDPAPDAAVSDASQLERSPS